MRNIIHKKLINGLNIIYDQDNTKNQTFVNMHINYGNSITNFKYNEKEYSIAPGTAHLFEHIIIETSCKYNFEKFFKKHHVTYNGGTNNILTYFNIETVKDFKKVFRAFIIMINDFIITEEEFEYLKEPIYNEIAEANDSINHNNKEIMYDNISCITRNNDVLGNCEILKNITLEEVKLIYFYQPKNQTLIIKENFDINEVEKIIRKYYLDKKNY